MKTFNLVRFLQCILFFAVGIAATGCATFENHKGENFPFTTTIIKSNQPAPTVIVSHGSACRIPQDDMWARRFNNWGYNAIIIDHCTVRKIAPYVGSIDIPLRTIDRINDYIAVAEWVKTQSWHKGKVAVFGISRGGQAALRAAHKGFLDDVRGGLEGLKQLDVYAALYPNCSIVPSEPLGPLMVMHGELDNLAEFAPCQYIYNQVNHPNFIFKSYPGAHHGFDVDNCNAVGVFKYSRKEFVSCRSNPSAAAANAKDVRQFFETHLK
jgi:dienelactone hydrolase